MKTILIVFLFGSISVLSAVSFADSSSCLNISGKYSAPWDTANRKTTFNYNQKNCEFIIISGYVIDRVRPSFTQFNPLTAYLNGQAPINEGLGPCYNSAPGTCASYTSASLFIIKTLDQDHVGFTASPSGGLCTYHESHLSKDVNGDLIEDLQIDSCDDGYTGKIAPLLFPAAK